ncbi:hypothetical protein ASD27_07875 [Mesorhizobium sp. Root1471]|nr:hypothetical protein ASD27_07875 [Mesorhizobium sp. Root1471]
MDSGSDDNVMISISILESAIYAQLKRGFDANGNCESARMGSVRLHFALAPHGNWRKPVPAI